MEKVLLLNSGGLDSAMLAKWLGEQYEVHSFFGNTHQLNGEYTSRAARITADRFCASHYEMDINLGQTSNYYLSDGVMEMYDGAVNKVGHLAVCPEQTRLLLGCAMAYALTIGCNKVFTGHKQIDQAFIDNMNNNNPYVGKSLLYGFDTVRATLVCPLKDCGSNYQTVMDFCGVTDIQEFSYTHSCNGDGKDNCPKCKTREAIGL